MTGSGQLQSLLDKITAREQAVASEAEQVRAHIDELAGRLRELDQEAEHLRITRKTVVGLADDLAEKPSPVLPEHPAYQQILAAFAEMRQPMRARDLCQALDLDIIPKNIEGTRHELKRLVERAILAEPEPGLFSRPRP
jgi:cell division septum initiation protein DivIVA